MTVEFLYPTSRQYPIDAACEEIVRALAARNFDVPGVTVSFRSYGSGEQHMRYVTDVTGENFRLHFGRSQGTLPGGRWADCAAVRDVTIPRQQISVYEDESGPTLHLYVGKDWEADKARFPSPRVNSKLNGEPRTYLQYRGACRCSEGTHGFDHSHPGKRSPLLVHTDDLGREYSPIGDEPTSFRTAAVLAKVNNYLRDVVLPEILACPEASEIVDPWPEPPAIPWPAEIGPLFCFASDSDVGRIRDGQRDPASLESFYRYAMSGAGWRLVGLDVPNDGTVPEVAYDGFLWCGLGEVAATIPGRGRLFDRYTLRIRPTRADGVYVADHGAYTKRRTELYDAEIAEAELRRVKPRDSFTDAEIADMKRARARTIVPITEYRGGFAEPVVLINRELGFDEVEIVEWSP